METQLLKLKFVSFLSLYLRLSAYNQVIPLASKQVRAKPKEDATLYTVCFVLCDVYSILDTV